MWSKKGNYKAYMHITPDGKRYVGTTCQSLKGRWGKNGNGYKGQAFYSAIEEFGWENIRHCVIAKGMNKSQADSMEKLLIRYYETNNPAKGYNKTKGGDRHCHARTCNKIICVNTQEVYGSVYQAEKATGIPNAYIYLCCSKNRNYAGYSSAGRPLQWMFYDEYLKSKSMF